MAGTLFTGTDGFDEIYGTTGDDTIRGLGDTDFLFGDQGNDLIDGGAGWNFLDGGSGNDTLIGGDDGNDIYAGAGDDVVNGGAGTDALEGEAGNDTLTGGAGDDSFHFYADLSTPGGTGWGHDVITDFNPNVDRLSIALNNGDEANLTVTDTANGALVDYDGITSILVIGVTAEELAIDVTVYSPSLILEGTESNDSLVGGDGDDQLYGAGGNDVLVGANGWDYLNGGAGADTLDGGDDSDQLNGDAGDDVLDGGTGDDYVNGGAGDDVVTGGQGFDTFEFVVTIDEDGLVTTPWGHDVITDYTAGEDQIAIHVSGETDSSFLTITDTADGALISVGADNTILVSGVAAADVSYYSFFEGDYIADGTPDSDFIFGRTTADTINGGESDDFIQSRGGDDVVTGGNGSDYLYGDGGNDILTGGSGYDDLNGGNGNDTLSGGDDDDFLIGGAGNDVLTGGAGADYFIFDLEFDERNPTESDFSWGNDIITDYDPLVDYLRVEIDGGDESKLTVTDTVVGTLISYDGTSSILVVGVSISDLNLDAVFE